MTGTVPPGGTTTVPLHSPPRSSHTRSASGPAGRRRSARARPSPSGHRGCRRGRRRRPPSGGGCCRRRGRPPACQTGRPGGAVAVEPEVERGRLRQAEDVVVDPVEVRERDGRPRGDGEDARVRKRLSREPMRGASFGKRPFRPGNQATASAAGAAFPVGAGDEDLDQPSRSGPGWPSDGALPSASPRGARASGPALAPTEGRGVGVGAYGGAGVGVGTQGFWGVGTALGVRTARRGGSAA